MSTVEHRPRSTRRPVALGALAAALVTAALVASAGSAQAPPSTLHFVSKPQKGVGFVPKPIDLDVLLLEIGRLLQLTWLYEPADGRMEPPPPQELEILSELALLGKMRQLRERAAALEQLDAKYRPFATHVQRLARGFDIKQIQALLKQYLEAKV